MTANKILEYIYMKAEMTYFTEIHFHLSARVRKNTINTPDGIVYVPIESRTLRIENGICFCLGQLV
jgi:hypothetical protein